MDLQLDLLLKYLMLKMTKLWKGQRLIKKSIEERKQLINLSKNVQSDIND